VKEVRRIHNREPPNARGSGRILASRTKDEPRRSRRNRGIPGKVEGFGSPLQVADLGFKARLAAFFLLVGVHPKPSSSFRVPPCPGRKPPGVAAKRAVDLLGPRKLNPRGGEKIDGFGSGRTLNPSDRPPPSFLSVSIRVHQRFNFFSPSASLSEAYQAALLFANSYSIDCSPSLLPSESRNRPMKPASGLK